MTVSASRNGSMPSAAAGIEPRAPAWLAAITIEVLVAFAMGAWMIGNSMPSRSRIRVSGQVLMGRVSNGGMLCRCFSRARQHQASLYYSLDETSVSCAISVDGVAEYLMNPPGNMRGVGFQGEVAGVEQLHHGVGVIAFVGMGARRDEEGIVLAPDHQRRHLRGLEKRLERRVQRQVVAVVEEQVQLDLVIAGALHQEHVEHIGLRRYQLRLRD